MTENHSLFSDYDVVYTYTRAQAIADGALVDVTRTARAAGLRFPVALTAELWNSFIIPPRESELNCMSIDGRLWTTLYLFRCAAAECESDMLCFDVPYVMKGRAQTLVKLKAVCGPGDSGEPVITIMLPYED